MRRKPRQALSLTDRQRAVLIVRAVEVIHREGDKNNSARFERLKRFLAKLDPDGGIQSEIIGRTERPCGTRGRRRL